MLLGPAEWGGDRRSDQVQRTEVEIDASAATIHNWRRIAEHWDDWPGLADHDVGAQPGVFHHEWGGVSQGVGGYQVHASPISSV